MYERGSITTVRAPWLQVIRLLGISLIPQIRRGLRSLKASSYALYAWLALITLAPPTWLLVQILPRLRWRWGLIGLSTRMLAFATATRINIKGLEHLPPPGTPCVLVCNHASYVDGLILAATLPRPVSFIAKEELNRQFIAGHFLRRIGAEFVERFDTQKGAEDTKRITRLVADGHTALFFLKAHLAAYRAYCLSIWVHLQLPWKPMFRSFPLSYAAPDRSYVLAQGSHATIPSRSTLVGPSIQMSRQNGTLGVLP